MARFKQLIFFISVAGITLLGCGLTNLSDAEQEEPAVAPPVSDQFTVVQVKVGSDSLNELLAAEAGRAKQLDQIPFVEFYADWCPPCNALRKSLNDERMIEAFAGTYIIQLDIDECKGKLSRAGFDVRGIPAFFEIDEAGRPTGRAITGAAWGEDIPENMAPPLKSFFRSSEAWPES